jgi:hypothetical protein
MKIARPLPLRAFGSLCGDLECGASAPLLRPKLASAAGSRLPPVQEIDQRAIASTNPYR